MSEIAIPELRRICLEALTKTGLSAEDAAMTADHYMENELSGKTSHGMVRVIEAIKALNEWGPPPRPPEIIKDTGSMAVIESHHAPGPVAGQYAVQLAIVRAKEHGIALIGARNYIANSGAMAYYLRLLVDENLIALVTCNSESMVCPPGGIKPLVGTNPIGLGVPGKNGRHFIADFATSAIAYGKILVMQEKGEALPEGVLIDAQGNPSTHPDDAFNGAIKPLADYRGFSLALMTELLAGPLIGAMACKREPGTDGLIIIAIDPAHLGHADYGTLAGPLLDQIRASAAAPGQDGVTLPGDRSTETLAKTLARGTVDVADKTLDRLQKLLT